MNHTLNYEKKKEKKKERLADKFLLHNYCVANLVLCASSQINMMNLLLFQEQSNIPYKLHSM